MKNVSAGKKFLCRTPIPEEKTVISSVTFMFALGVITGGIIGLFRITEKNLNDV